jgi:hypothetical protein
MKTRKNISNKKIDTIINKKLNKKADFVVSLRHIKPE